MKLLRALPLCLSLLLVADLSAENLKTVDDFRPAAAKAKAVNATKPGRTPDGQPDIQADGPRLSSMAWKAPRKSKD